MINLYATKNFKSEYEKLVKNKSYTGLEQKIIQEFFQDKKIKDFYKKGTKLNIDNQDTPLVKLRVGGSSGYRLYFTLVITKSAIYLGFIHPKRGSKAISNIGSNKVKEVLKDIVGSIKEDELYEVIPCEEGLKLLFAEKVK